MASPEEAASDGCEGVGAVRRATRGGEGRWGGGRGCEPADPTMKHGGGARDPQAATATSAGRERGGAPIQIGRARGRREWGGVSVSVSTNRGYGECGVAG